MRGRKALCLATSLANVHKINIKDNHGLDDSSVGVGVKMNTNRYPGSAGTAYIMRPMFQFLLDFCANSLQSMPRNPQPPSSRGLGRRVLIPVTRVRIPLGVPLFYSAKTERAMQAESPGPFSALVIRASA